MTLVFHNPTFLKKIVLHIKVLFNLKVFVMERKELDLTKDQHLMSIIKNGECIGNVEIENGKIVTNGFVGENVYENFVDLIWGLQGFDIAIDNFYF